MPLLTRDDLGYYSRVEMTLVLALDVLREKGNYAYASIRALSAFFGDRTHGMYSIVRRAKENGLVETSAVASTRNRGRAYVNVVKLTPKGATLVSTAIKRVTRVQ
jgi:DNA-binding PadR family transcriptional regulator